MRFEPTDWKGYCTEIPVLDVRSPAEHTQGHMPGAISFPLFSDEERAQVGTVYKQEDPEKAFTLGLSIAGPKMAGFVEKAKALAPERRVSIYCWRGGQRSSSMAWLLEQAGFTVNVMQGGYKAWRNHALDSLSSKRFSFRVVGGMTGVGKTEVIHALEALGKQVLDLEGMANHRGSAFGSRGLQPTVEQFENDLFAAMEHFDPAKPIWVEDESKSIGRVFIPLSMWEQMQESPLFQVCIPEQERIRHIVGEYGKMPIEELKDSFERIGKRLGGQHLKQALAHLENGNLEGATAIALRYYDKSYQHLIDQRPEAQVQVLRFEELDATEIAKTLIKKAADKE